MSTSLQAARLWGAVAILRNEASSRSKRGCAVNMLIWLSLGDKVAPAIRDRARSAMIRHCGIAVASEMPAVATGAGNEAS